MRDEDIHIGDEVRVRQWDDMVKEFGIKVDSKGRKYRSIPISAKHTCFSEDMKEYCGLSLTIKGRKHISAHGSGYKFEEKSGIAWYFVCAEMLELVENSTDFEVASDDDVRLLLG